MEVTSITKRQKSSSSKVKSEANACVFLRQQGNYSPRVCPWGTNCHWKFLFECSGTPMEEDRPCTARVLSIRQFVFLHDNVPLHRAVAVQEFLARKQVCVLHHPSYSPDLSPCDYFIFPKLKLPLKGRLFEDVQDIQAAVTSSLRAIPQEDVQRSFQSLLDRATCCIDTEGMYFE